MNLYQWIKLKFSKKIEETEKPNKLHCYRQYTYHGDYSKEEKFKKMNLSDILNFFREAVTPSGGVSIESKFNGIHYAVFDLDELDQLELFRKLYTATPYVLFRTSPDHHWAIVDQSFDKIQDIFFEPNWKVCNDQKYIQFCRNYNKLFLRGIYENESRKPCLYHTNGILSKNFQLFINNLCIYLNKEGLELSVLRYKDPTMLIKYNRKRKLQQLKDYENNQNQTEEAR